VPALTAEQRAAIHRRMTTANYRDHRLDDGVLRFVCEPVDSKRMHVLLNSFCRTTGIQKPRYQRGVLVCNSIHEYAGKGVSEDLASLVKTAVGRWVSAGSLAAQRYASGLRRFESLPNRWCLQAFFKAWRFLPRLVRARQCRRHGERLEYLRHFSLQCLVIRAFEALFQHWLDNKLNRASDSDDRHRRRLDSTWSLATALACADCQTQEQVMDRHGRGKLTPAGSDPSPLFGPRFSLLRRVENDVEWARVRLAMRI
jgi:hypothetical protein